MLDKEPSTTGPVRDMIARGEIRALDYFPAQGEVCPVCGCADFKQAKSTDGIDLLICVSCDTPFLLPQQNITSQTDTLSQRTES